MNDDRRLFLRAAAGVLLSGGGPPARAEPLLARWYEPGTDPAPYLVSEKYDGVRALWDGRRLCFRSGRTIAAPADFLHRLPDVALDGELWLDRGRFDDLSAAVRRTAPRAEEWAALRYLVFDAPQLPAGFGERHGRLRQIVAAAAHPQLQVVEQFRVADEAALNARLARVVAGGGEGLMLHRADARHRPGRGGALLKLKPMRDREAVVVAHLPGRGRLAGRLGALELRTPEGGRFRLGSGFSDAQRADPPPIGATVSYRYRGLTPGGVPRFASYIGPRPD